jgi:5-methylcytosine-specific restriction endonuclease McrA
MKNLAIGKRIRLDPKSYRGLYRQILQRDGWRCQICGSMRNLQVHHMKFRSQSGDDSEANLITLCAGCHTRLHHSETPG